jgi:hypothetical protein
MRNFVFLLVAGLAAWSVNASARSRHELTSALRVKDLLNGRTVRFTPGYQFEITRPGEDTAHIRFFDPQGLEVQGEFEVPARLVQEALQADIAEALKAAEVPAVKSPGCCEVDGAEAADRVQLGANKIAEREPVRPPAIAPGTSIVYEDVPVPMKRPEQPEEKELLLAFPSNPPIPKPRPKRESDQVADRVQERAPKNPPVSEPPRSPASRDPLCKALSMFIAQGVPDAPVRQALYFLSKARADGRVARNSRYLALGDYSQRSDRKRFFLLDLENHSIKTERVSHGGGKRRAGRPGDPNHDGRVDKCSRKKGDGMHRAGFFRVGEYYYSQSGRYSRWPMITRKPPRNGMKLHGLTPRVNGRAFEDGVVMHEAPYNNPTGYMGRSESCPAFVPGRGKEIMDKLAQGSLYYSYTPACRDDMVKVLAQVKGWQGFCR